VATEKVVVEATAFLRRLRPNNLLPSQSSFFPVIVQLLTCAQAAVPGRAKILIFGLSVFDYGRLTD
jgi:hypothetical protein